MTITLNRRPVFGAPIVLDIDALSGANLSGANLCGADLSGVNLYGADLCGADLRGAYLYGADLNRADLCGANLYGARIKNGEINSLIASASRLDGYTFLAFRMSDDTVKIMAGCRWMTPDEYRAHVAAEYPGTDKARETLDIIEFIERRAAV